MENIRNLLSNNNINVDNIINENNELIFENKDEIDFFNAVLLISETNYFELPKNIIENIIDLKIKIIIENIIKYNDLSSIHINKIYKQFKYDYKILKLLLEKKNIDIKLKNKISSLFIDVNKMNLKEAEFLFEFEYFSYLNEFDINLVDKINLEISSSIHNKILNEIHNEIKEKFTYNLIKKGYLINS